MHRVVALMVLLMVPLGACRTPEGPRIALPPQDLRTPVPSGYARVIVFNDTPPVYFVEGNIQIWIEGMSAPSLYLHDYTQLFLQPGTYEFLFEHWDFLFIRNRYEITVSEPETLIRIRSGQMAARYELVEELPDDFEVDFVGGPDRRKWPRFHPLSQPPIPTTP